jgi:tryptophan synthase alpha subunit
MPLIALSVNKDIKLIKIAHSDFEPLILTTAMTGIKTPRLPALLDACKNKSSARVLCWFLVQQRILIPPQDRQTSKTNQNLNQVISNG